jgi:hypothetical protein
VSDIPGYISCVSGNVTALLSALHLVNFLLTFGCNINTSISLNLC